MQYQLVNDICYSFNWTIKKWWKFSEKTDFGAHFERFLVYALLRSMSYASIPFEMKGLIEIHNRVKFHHYTISGYQVVNFQRFL